MKYYFKITNNNIDNSYMYSEEEIISLFPGIDLNTQTPNNYIIFKPSNLIRNLGPYEKINFLGYEYVDETTITDKLEIVRMSDEEIENKKNETKQDFYSRVGYHSWVLNEEHCLMVPPFPPPNDEFVYGWDEKNQTFVKTEQKKIDLINFR